MHPFMTAWLKKQKLERDYLLWYDARQEYDNKIKEVEEMMEACSITQAK